MFSGMLKLSGGEVSAWTARLPSVLAGILSVLLVFDIGRKRWGDRAGLLAGIILMTAPLFMRQTPTARLDVLFTGWIVLGAWAWLSAPSESMTTRLSASRVFVFWLGVIGAVMTKGPLALVCLFGMLLGESWRLRSWGPWRSVRPLIGFPALLAVVGLWLWSQSMSQGFDFLKEQLSVATVDRLETSAHANPPWYFMEHMLGDVFLPWLPFLIFGFFIMWKQRKEGLEEGLSALLFWAIIPFLVLHFSSGKRAQYLVPIIPPLALITGWTIDRRVMNRELPRWLYQALLGLVVTMGIALAAASIVFKVSRGPLWSNHFLVNDLHSVLLAAAIPFVIFLGVYIYRQRTTRRFLITLAALTILGECVYSVVLNTAQNDWRSSYRLSKTIEGLLKPGETEIAAAGKADRAKYHVYGDYSVETVQAGTLATMTPSNLPRLIVCREEDGDEYRRIERSGRYHRVGATVADGDLMKIYVRNEAAEAKVTADSAPLSFAVVGDTGELPKEQYRLVGKMAAMNDLHPFRAVMLLGDNIYGDEPFNEGFRIRFLDVFEPLLNKRIPFYAAIGNHDTYPPEKLNGELAEPLLHMNGRPYYTETFGGGLITFFILNSETLANDPAQALWFDNELSVCESIWKVVILHRPLQASEVAHGPSRSLYKILRRDLVQPNGIDLVLAGHNHLYERRKPLDGVTHVTIGSGGDTEKDRTFPPDPNRAVGYGERKAFGWMQVFPDRIHFKVVSETGEVVDEFELQPRSTRSLIELSGDAGTTASVPALAAAR